MNETKVFEIVDGAYHGDHYRLYSSFDPRYPGVRMVCIRQNEHAVGISGEHIDEIIRALTALRGELGLPEAASE